MQDRSTTVDGVVSRLRDGMTIGIGGWGSRRKPMALVRAILRSELRDLTLVSYGGPDVGLLAAAGKLRKVVYGFVSLDSVPLDPHFRAARQRGELDVAEYDEGMVLAGLRAAAARLPFLPTRAGLGSDVMALNPGLTTVTSPYADGEELVAMPALELDVALVHMNRADRAGNGQYLGPDPYFDDLFCAAAAEAYVSCEQLVSTEELLHTGPLPSLLLDRTHTTGVVETPNGAHFTSCVPDHERDEPFQRQYAASGKSAEAWQEFRERFLSGDESDYQQAVDAFHAGATERQEARVR
ncbi:CoA transferase subunit A [Allosaccharopolyspora coralli]|uniref:CoA transferase subunit A n=1 Tax=Allosaccharopolyspora coralli TaxID=2665642 RepID=UPI001C9E7AF8|nr:CoA-transferase [Allosaccharopolyspora coralli]